MSKRLVLLFCAIFAFAAVAPAFAAVQNVKVSGDILARGIARNNFDLTKGDGSSGEDQIGVLNTVVRLRVDADLTDNIQTTIRLINERNWGDIEGAEYNDSDIDLDLAFVTIKEMFCTPLTMMIGRQEMLFGNGMVIGANGTNQTTNYNENQGYNFVNGDLAYRSAFDAIRASLNYDPLVIDFVFAKIDENQVTSDENNDDVNLIGMNAGYKFDDDWKTAAEAYVWGKLDSAARLAGNADERDEVYTMGGRVSTTPFETLNIQQELAMQRGTKVDGSVARDRKAFAAQTMVTLTPGWELNPVMGLVYSYFSGDAAVTAPGSEKDYHGWDSMYESQTAGHIINALFPQTNCHNFNLMASFVPVEDVTIRGDYVYQMLAKAFAESGTFDLNDYDGSGLDYEADKKALGQEIDLTVTYDYTEDVQFSLLTGLFFPSSAISEDQGGLKGDQMASEAIASMKVVF